MPDLLPAFLLLRDRRAALQSLRSLSPLSEAEMDRLFSRVERYNSRYDLRNAGCLRCAGPIGRTDVLVVGSVGALALGSGDGLLAVVPVLGAFVVWIPAALFLALEGSWGKALILTCGA